MQKRSSILLIYTGGTIGMINDPVSGELKSFDFKHMYNQIPELNRLPATIHSASIEKPIDSSEMTPGHWLDLVKIIEKNYANYDGFVILHGSDTMAYTASALSFLIQGTKKPIILTGSQLPIGTIRTDGKENLITAIEIAAQKDEYNQSVVQEVCVYFEYSLYRGNRSSKVSANQFQAFRSPNYPPLAVAGVHIDYDFDKLYRSTDKTITFWKTIDNQVGLLKLYPGLPVEAYQSLFDLTKFKALVLETFGSGNASSSPVFQSYIRTYIEAGGIVLNISQCSSGAVEQGKYETSSFFQKVGVISGADMTTEAALTKLM
jgi:L-asparaginase